MPPALRVLPSTEQKLELLGKAASFDLSCACGPSSARERGADGRWIYPAALPTGKRIPLLKILQQSGCDRGCAYCAERRGGQSGHVAFSPDELARLFMQLHQQGRVAGLFLSSAIRGRASSTMDRLLATAEILRRKQHFRGYLHLKIIPGATPAQVDQAMALATRVSVNLELPTARHLRLMAPGKDLQRQILAPMRQVAQAETEGRFDRGGQTTQLVVGVSDETDAQIARSAAHLYRRLRLRRVYYSGFQPVAGTPMEGRPPVAFMREHRLYQMDFLLRCYGFELEEIPFDDEGQLSLATDPKTRWVRLHPERFPIEVNTAEPAQLVRVPGIGPRCSARIVQLRRLARIRSLDALRAAGARQQLAAPYVLLDGRRPAGEQLRLF